MHAMKKTAGQRLTEAQREFARWRQGCRRPGRIPTELWMLAAEAAAEQGVEQTAPVLQLNAERLEQWCQELGLICKSPKNEGMQFLELSPMPWTTAGECQLEIEDPSGRKLRISLTGAAIAQLPQLLPTLCGKEVAS